MQRMPSNILQFWDRNSQVTAYMLGNGVGIQRPRTAFELSPLSSPFFYSSRVQKHLCSYFFFQLHCIEGSRTDPISPKNILEDFVDSILVQNSFIHSHTHHVLENSSVTLYKSLLCESDIFLFLKEFTV